MASKAGIGLETINTYLESLHHAFVIRAIRRTDKNLHTLKRDVQTKYMLENTAHYSLLFGGLPSSNSALGNIVEACVFSQTLPFPNNMINYANYSMNRRTYEIDMIHRHNKMDDISRICEIKWSNNESDLREATINLRYFAKKHKLESHSNSVYCTTKSSYPNHIDQTGTVKYLPVAQYCLMLGMELFDSGVYSHGLKNDPFEQQQQELNLTPLSER